MEGDSPTVTETRRVRELLQTALAQQDVYSYSRDRIHSTPRPSRSPSYIRHMDSADMSSNARRCNQPRRHEPVQAGALNLTDQERIRQEAERAVQLAAEQAAHQTFLAYPATSVEAGVATRTRGVPFLVPVIRNERLPKDFKGPRKVPNYMADL